MGTINVLDKVSLELKKLSKNPKNVKDYSKFHKDGKMHIGIATPLVRKVASKYFKKIRNLNKKQIFALCEKLLNTRGSSYQDITFDWAFRTKNQYQKEIFDFVIKNKKLMHRTALRYAIEKLPEKMKKDAMAK